MSDKDPTTSIALNHTFSDTDIKWAGIEVDGTLNIEMNKACNFINMNKADVEALKNYYEVDDNVKIYDTKYLYVITGGYAQQPIKTKVVQASTETLAKNLFISYLQYSSGKTLEDDDQVMIQGIQRIDGLVVNALTVLNVADIGKDELIKVFKDISDG